MSHGVRYATVRDGGDELHIECRFENGEKFAAVKVDSDRPELAQWVASALSGQLWQPIETAPKNGRVLLACWLNGGWSSVVASHYDADDIAEWENGDACDPGWYERSVAHEAATEAVYAVEGRPEFWQPMPAKPEKYK